MGQEDFFSAMLVCVLSERERETVCDCVGEKNRVQNISGLPKHVLSSAGLLPLSNSQPSL